MDKLLFTDEDWTLERIDRAWAAIEKIAKEKYKLDYYPAELTIINSEAMLDAYSSNAMPIYYRHWSFGKSYAQNEHSYNKGELGLAYEVVINTNPCISYLQSSNTMTMQTLVMAHAAVGHSHFFKNNFLFKEWTDAEFILPYLKFAKEFVEDCEIKHGRERVEGILNAAHALQDYGVDTFKKKRESLVEETNRLEDLLHTEDYVLERLTPRVKVQDTTKQKYKENRAYPEENILYFIEKMSPSLEPWERELVRIVRQTSQYFYPQRQTKVMNEGWATFWHYTLMTDLWDQGSISDGSYLRFIDYHTMVVNQQPFSRSINPYVLGFKMFMDLKRICENPTEEDKQWFPDICNTNWLETLTDIMESYRDESFVAQFLSPKLIRDLKFMHITGVAEEWEYTISKTHQRLDVRGIREALSKQYDLMYYIPRLEITDVDWSNTRALSITAHSSDRFLLDLSQLDKTKSLLETNLWKFPVRITQIAGDDNEK